MRNISFSCLVTFLLLSACQSEQVGEKRSASGPSVYSIDVNAKSVDFLDQVESISVFGFEETAESLLNENVLFFEYEEGYVVVDESSGTVYLFDVNGAYVSKFNRMGQGPEEYPYMRQTQYRDGLIETFVLGAKKALQFDLEGNLIQSLDLPYFASHVFYYKNEYLLGMGNQVDLDSINYDVIFADDHLKPKAFAMPFNKPNGVPLAGPNNEFRVFDEQILFNPFWTDSVYQINGTQVKPYLRFDFGNDWLWKDLPLSRDFKIDMIQGKVWGYSWVIGKERIEIEYMTDFDQPPKIGFIDRETNEFFHYKYDWSRRERLPYVPLRFEGDKLLAVFLADELSEVLDVVDEANVSVKGFLSIDQLLASENPVLVWVKFK